jgi:hypothetical protein
MDTVTVTPQSNVPAYDRDLFPHWIECAFLSLSFALHLLIPSSQQLADARLERVRTYSRFPHLEWI